MRSRAESIARSIYELHRVSELTWEQLASLFSATRFTAGLLAQFDPEPERTSKPGIKTKRKMCSWRYDFALQALTGQKIMR